MRKKKIRRRIEAFLLSLTLLLSVIPVGAYGAELDVESDDKQIVQTESGTEQHVPLEENLITNSTDTKEEAAEDINNEFGEDLESFEENTIEDNDIKEQDSAEPETSNVQTEKIEETTQEDIEKEAPTTEDIFLENPKITITDIEGNLLPVCVEDVENSEEILKDVDYSKVSGMLVWLQKVTVDYEDAMSVKIPLVDVPFENLQNKVIKVVCIQEGNASEYVDAKIQDENIASFEAKSLSTIAVFVAENLYHYTQEDLSTILTWKEQYMPEGYEDLSNYQDFWWDSLYDYERELAEFLKEQTVDLSAEVYDGQDLNTCISIIENGIGAKDFFKGTVFQNLTLDDLYSLQKLEFSIDDVYNAVTYSTKEGTLTGWRIEDEGTERMQKLEDIVWKLVPQNTMLRIVYGDQIAEMTVTNTGYQGMSHGTIWKLNLGGKPALCLNQGKTARNGYLYHADQGTYEERNDGIGYLVSRAGMVADYYVSVQLALWLYQQSQSYTKEEVEFRVYAMLYDPKTSIKSMAEKVWNYYYGATQNSYSYYVYHSENYNAQDVCTLDMPYTYTFGGNVEGSYETETIHASADEKSLASAEITITKHDSITDEVLDGTKIQINGKIYTTDKNGEVTHIEEDEYEASAEGTTYTYVKDWDSLSDVQKADADKNGFYHNKEEAYRASQDDANAKLKEQLDEWENNWKADFQAVETAPPYGYTDNVENVYDTTAGDSDHNYSDFYNKPWEAWIKVTKYDSITGQTDVSLADAEFCVYEYNIEKNEYIPYRYSDRQVLIDNQDGTYHVGPLYFNPKNEGKFMIQETRAPLGYSIDQKQNRFYFEITGEKQIALANGNVHNTAGTYSASKEHPYEFLAYNEPWKVKVEAIKIDEDTGELLSGVAFDILRLNRDTNDYEVTTNYTPNDILVKEQPNNTYLSDWIYWNYQNQGKFYLVESKAKKGYFGAWKDRFVELLTGHLAGWKGDDENGKEAYYFQITGSRTEEGIVEGYNNGRTLRASAGDKGVITNERTKGKITVVKYDTESESLMVQGDASIEGAMYELRAAEDIIHADGHTGVIYKKGDLVMTGTVGKSPVLDRSGYLLNTEGKRYAAYGGEIQYRDTPGEFSLYNIELGTYTLKEVKAGNGYMLDETTYKLTFTYGDETQRILLRDESAAQDSNTLTMDDADMNHDRLYTGGYVRKQAFAIKKIINNQSQSAQIPVEGAGFMVYLVSDLKRVENGNLLPENGQSWSEVDIRKFYDYDFTSEESATVYKRKLETWTEGDKCWLVPAKGGNKNEYYVSEMFTDKEGYLISPELPYGMYVVVETTIPEGYVMANPFFVNISEDGGVVYTDDTRQTILESFREECNIRYGDHTNKFIYQDPTIYQPDAIEGRVAQTMRYVLEDQTKAYLRLVKTDSSSLPDTNTIHKPEDLISNTVLKEGAAYRIRIDHMTDREQEALTTSGWTKDLEGYICYCEPSTGQEYGTNETPFMPTLQRNKEGKITDCYLTLPVMLPTGCYEIVEIQAPSGYVRNGQEHILKDTSTDRMHSYEVLDHIQKPMKFVLDNQLLYPNGQMGEHKYTLADSSGNIVCTVLQDNQEQKGVLELIKYGEKLYDYTKDHQFEYQKAPIEGAIFGVYAAEDIYTQELDRKLLDEYKMDISDYLVWKKDQKIAELITDQTGYAYLADLYIGKYYVKEIYAGEGFVRNPEIQSFEIKSQADHVSFDWAGIFYENQRQKIDLQVRKEDIEDGSALEGAVFGLYNKQDICSYIEENPSKNVPDNRHIKNAFDYINQDKGKVLIPKNTLIATAVTSKDGIAIFEPDLPLGEYYIKELEDPIGYTSTDQMEVVSAAWQGHERNRQEYHNIVFQNQRTRHIFTKSDLISGVPIEGAYLEIWEVLQDEHGNPKKNADGSYMLGKEPIDVWVSSAEGEEIHYFYEDNGFYLKIDSPEDLPEGKDLIQKEGHLVEHLTVGKMYIFRETLAPKNYVGYQASSKETRIANQEQNAIDEEVLFLVEDQNKIVTHDLKDQRTVGTFTVTKEGEFFVGTKKDLHFWDKVKNLFETVFLYAMGRVENVSFQVYVRDDIYTPDGTGNYAEWTNSEGKTLLLKKDTLIDTITTDQFGLATVQNLPLGTYYLRETAALEGTFILNREEKEIVLSYVDQDTPVVFSDSTTYINERQKISITLHKKETGTDRPIQGAIFGLYAGEDLYGYVVNEERVVSAWNKPFIEKDTLIETVESDEDGTAVFQADVPSGSYYVREIQAPTGYSRTDEVWRFDASYQGADGESVLSFEQDIYNKHTKKKRQQTIEPHMPEPVDVPQTGDHGWWAVWASMAFFAATTAIWLMKRRR